MSDDNSGRKKQRINVRFGADYHGRRISGSGVVTNISESGALIDEAEPLLVSGGRIRLRFSFYDGSLPIEIGAVVVRPTETGFAVRFTGLDARLRSLLAMAVAKLRNTSHEASGVPGADDDDEVTLMTIQQRED